MQRITVKSIGMFWSRVDKTPGQGKNGECWIYNWWGDDYGRMSSGGVTMGAHVFSYILANGAVPEGLVVCHKCDTPRCVRPDHLEACTQSHNVRSQARYANNKGI